MANFRSRMQSNQRVIAGVGENASKNDETVKLMSGRHEYEFHFFPSFQPNYKSRQICGHHAGEVTEKKQKYQEDPNIKQSSPLQRINLASEH